MLPERSAPAGLETANTRGGGLRWHRHQDWSCEIDCEQIPYGASHFEGRLLEDMRVLSQARLEKVYKELIFGFHEGPQEPKQRDFRAKLTDSRGRCRGYRWACWRKS